MNLNELIEQILANFEVDGVTIPVAYMFYQGHGEPYITYEPQNIDHSFSGDDRLIGYANYYDFDVYSKGNFLEIIKQLRARLEAHDFVWQPSLSSEDFYEPDTEYFHKTLNFAYLVQEAN